MSRIRPEPLVFLLRSRRQWYGETELTQRELAELAGVPASFVEEYERLRRLPVSLRHVLRLTLALQVPFEKLVAPQVVDRLLDEIGARRKTLAARRARRSA